MSVKLRSRSLRRRDMFLSTLKEGAKKKLEVRVQVQCSMSYSPIPLANWGMLREMESNLEEFYTEVYKKSIEENK